jgi:hypothetical protein
LVKGGVSVSSQPASGSKDADRPTVPVAAKADNGRLNTKGFGNAGRGEPV